MLTEAKPATQSRTIRASLAGILTTLAIHFLVPRLVDMGVETQQALTLVASLVALTLAGVYRVLATHRIGPTQPPKQVGKVAMSLGVMTMSLGGCGTTFQAQTVDVAFQASAPSFVELTGDGDLVCRVDSPNPLDIQFICSGQPTFTQQTEDRWTPSCPVTTPGTVDPMPSGEGGPLSDDSPDTGIPGVASPVDPGPDRG